VFGMPKEAIRMEAAERIMPLDELPRAILQA
jgi:chemotaxis response regulator CheB